MNKDPITVQITVKVPLATVWACWNEPKHIPGWAFASDDWEVPSAENDVRVGGTLKIAMAAKDKSDGFDLIGTYNAVQEHKLVEYYMNDGRHVKVVFAETPDGVQVSETFDPENENPPEVQKEGWLAILNNFKKYAEQQ